MSKIGANGLEPMIGIHTRVAFKRSLGHGVVGRVIGIKKDELVVEIDRGFTAALTRNSEYYIIKRSDAFVCPESDLEDEKTEDEND